MSSPKFRTIAFSMVKNEIDIIEPFVRHNMQFVDAMIVFDHYSTDGTREVLLNLSREYGTVAVCTYDGDAHDQGAMLTKQLAGFQQKFRADLAVFLDADEFIRFDAGMDFANCTNDLSSGGVGLMPWRTFIPNPNAPIGLTEPLDRFTLRRRREKPERYKAVLRLDAASAGRFRVSQGSHSIRNQLGRKISAKILTGVHLMHFPVRSIEQLVAKSKIGSLTNSLRSDHKAKTEASQWQRVAAMERLGKLREGNQFLFEEAMVYGQSPCDGNFIDNVEPSEHGISAIRCYSDGLRQNVEKLYKAEVDRIRPQVPDAKRWPRVALRWLKIEDQCSDLNALRYLVRKFGQSGLFFDPDFLDNSGFSTASPIACAVHVRLVDTSPADDFALMHFDTLVAQSLSGSKKLRENLHVFVRAGGLPKPGA